jgi:hypothetical protein
MYARYRFVQYAAVCHYRQFEYVSGVSDWVNCVDLIFPVDVPYSDEPIILNYINQIILCWGNYKLLDFCNNVNNSSVIRDLSLSMTPPPLSLSLSLSLSLVPIFYSASYPQNPSVYFIQYPG